MFKKITKKLRNKNKSNFERFDVIIGGIIILWFMLVIFLTIVSWVCGIIEPLTSSASINITTPTPIITLIPTVTQIPTPTKKEITVKAINKFLKKKLKDKGEVIYTACKTQSPIVNPTLMTAIILLEVGGDCNSNVLNKANNVGGLNWYEGCGYPKYGWYMDFTHHGGIDTSIHIKAKILSRYINEGRDNITSIGLKYAPPNDSRNGIGGMNNRTWAKNVEAWFKRINKEIA